MQAMLGPKDAHEGNDLLSPDELMGFGSGPHISDHHIDTTSGRGLNLRGLPSAHSTNSGAYQAGMYVGEQR